MVIYNRDTGVGVRGFAIVCGASVDVSGRMFGASGGGVCVCVCVSSVRELTCG